MSEPFAVDRDTFIACIEAGIANSGNSVIFKAKLTDREIQSVREVGQTANEVTLRTFTKCPLSLANLRDVADWGFIDGYDTALDKVLDLITVFETPEYPQKAIVVIE